MASFSGPKLSNRIADDVPDIQAVLSSLAKLTPDSGNTDYPIGTKRVAETTNGYEFQQYNGTGWVTLEKWNLDAQKVDGYSASTGTTANTIPVRNANGKLPGDILGNAATATKANALSETNPIPMGGTGATTAEQARANLGTPPKTHASTSTRYGIGTSTQYGHLKSHDAPDATKTAATGHAFSPAGAADMQDVLEGQIGDLAGVVSSNAAAQTAKDAAQDEAISAKVATVNGLTPDSNGNVDVGGMPLGTVFPYTGKDVPAGTLRADGTTYTDMRSSFPEFYEWVVNSGLTVPLADYSLVEGNCGYYGLDESTGTVRMPTITNGFVGAATAGQYGQAVQAGLPNITGVITYITADATNTNSGDYPTRGAFRWLVHDYSSRAGLTSGLGSRDLDFDASRSSTVYGNSNTVTPSHVKYPWVIVVYNAAVPPSVAEAAEFIGLLDGKVDKVNPKDSEGNDILTSAGGTVIGNLNLHASLLWESGGSTAVFYDQANKTQLWVNAQGGFHVRPKGNSNYDFMIKEDGTPYSKGTLVLTGAGVVTGEVSGKSFTLPSGGTWKYMTFTHNDVYVYSPYGGTAAGGTTITRNGGYPVHIIYIAVRVS